MSYPALIIDHEKLKFNMKTIVDWCEQSNIWVAGIIKGHYAMPSVVQDYVDSGAKMLGSSRLSQLRKVKEMNLGVPLLMIRIPMMSELKELVELAEYSLQSEVATLDKLNKVAEAAGKRHNVILMADMGDLREGFFNEDELIAAALHVENELDWLHLAGIGTNLGCYGSVMPTEKNMNQLAKYAEDIESVIGRQLEIVSGGATSSLMPVFDGVMPSKINMLRIGAVTMTGPMEDIRVDYGREEIDALYGDCFTLKMEVIEVKDKPTHPIGELGVNAFGEKPVYVDRGVRKRALLAGGRADYGDFGDIIPDLEGAEIIGASGDHTILDIEECETEIKVGDIITFRLKYSAILRLSLSKDVMKYKKNN